MFHSCYPVDFFIKKIDQNSTQFLKHVYRVKTSGVRAALFSEDILIKRQVGDLTPMSSIQLTPDKYEVKNIETSIFLERILHTFYRLLKTLESFVSSSIILSTIVFMFLQALIFNEC